MEHGLLKVLVRVMATQWQLTFASKCVSKVFELYNKFTYTVEGDDPLAFATRLVTSFPGW